MSVIAELKRRNVFRVAAAYVVLSWLLLQIGDVLFEALALPEWSIKMLVALLALGVVPTLIFSWAYEITPEGVKREKDVVRNESITPVTARRLDVVTIGLIVVAIGFVTVDRIWLRPGLESQKPAESAQAEKAQRPVTAQLAKSVAVLPLMNVGGDPANEPFTVGIHDDLLTQISRIGELKTISRTSVMQYRDTTKTITQIGNELGVLTILEGGIQRAGDRVRINMQLIDVSSDTHLWAEVYDRELTVANLFDVQSEIASAVAQALQATLLPEQQAAMSKTPTEVLAAYDLYQMGRHHWHKRTAESLELARDYFEQALEADPDFVLAMSGLADSYTLLVEYGNREGRSAYQIADDTIDRAMALDNTVSEVWASLGLLRRAQGKEKESQEALTRAIELDPKNFQAWYWYQQTLQSLRLFEESMDAARRAYALEPMHILSNEALGFKYQQRGDFVRARQHWARADQVRDVHPTLYQERIATCLIASGALASGIAKLREVLSIAPRNTVSMDQLVNAHVQLGNHSEANVWATRGESLSPFFTSMMYRVHEAQEDYKSAVVYLEEKLSLHEERRDMGVLFRLFRASYLDGEITTARNYLNEYLSHKEGRVEINRFAIEHRDELLIADFFIRHAEPSTDQIQHGRKIVEEVIESLLTLNSSGFDHPDTYASLAIAHAILGNSIELLDALGHAIDAGFRDRFLIAHEPVFDSFRMSGLLEDAISRVDALVEAESTHLETLELAAYDLPRERTRVVLSRAQLRAYEGYFTDQNLLLHFYLDEHGQFTLSVAQIRTFPLLAESDERFFTPLISDYEFEFARDEAGIVTHVLFKDGRTVTRFKSTVAPRPAVTIDRSILARYLGRFGYDRHAGREDRTDADLWVLEVTVDEEGLIWFDFDNQPRLQAVAVSDNEFRMIGFFGYLSFVADPVSGNVARVVYHKGGREMRFNRLADAQNET